MTRQPTAHDPDLAVEFSRLVAPRRKYIDQRNLRAQAWVIADRERLLTSGMEPFHEALATLVNLDLLDGQPPVRSDAVRTALSGTSPVDGAYWEEISQLTHVFLVDTERVLVGACAFGIDEQESFVLLWLHAGENPQLIQRLLEIVDHQAHGTRVRAFPFASALSLGLEGIPLHRRPYTHQAMLEAGYVAHDDWGYHVRDSLDGDWSGPDLAEIEVDAEGMISLRVRHSERVVAEAHVQVAEDGTGIGWWLHVEPDMRGIGMGRVVFNQAMRELARRGATHAVLLVDDAPTSENSRDRAKRMYWTAGFRERDRLISYEKAPEG